MVLPLDVDARDGEEKDQPGERQRQQHAEEPSSRAVLHVSSVDPNVVCALDAVREVAYRPERTTALG
jgi:hypothetical protein